MNFCCGIANLHTDRQLLEPGRICCIIIMWYFRIDENGIIKVADFGLTEDMYNSNYYRREKRQAGTEERVPLKWMALESIETHVFDESTDMVSQV